MLTQLKKKTVTILDIARDAGVSPSTVSRVLSGNDRVDPEKRAAVLASTERLKFRPNAVAQGLARGRSQTIGVLTQNLNSLFYSDILLGINQRLHGSGYYPIFAPGNWHLEDELAALDALLRRQIDALILLAGQIPDERIAEVSEQIPVVVLGRVVPGLEQRCLVVNNFHGGYSATRHLIDYGHTRIAHITGLMEQQDARERLRGYRQALADAGIDAPAHLIVEGEFTELAGIMGVEMLFTRGAMFSAIFAASDSIAYGARLALFRHNIRVPDEVSLIGFDDQPSSLYTIPPLTTVRQPARTMGTVGAEVILRLLGGEDVDLPLLGTELVVRESTRKLL